MIGTFLESQLVTLSAAYTTDVFIVLMIGIFGAALGLRKKDRHGLFVEHAPALLVSIGILGTFVGIVIGLLGFDAQDIKNSIEGLLGGLKTAFITSLVGMSLSITLKAMDTWGGAPGGNEAVVAPDDVTPAHIHAALNRQVQLLEGLNRSIAGDEEGSLSGQFKMLRADVGDLRTSLLRENKEFREALFGQLNQFADMLSRSATEVVIEALRQVIQDFNQHLVEQFGENFKSLNQSVIKMIDWQELYKQHVEALEGRIETAVRELERTASANEAISQALVTSERSIGSIESHCNAIPGAIGQLEPVLQVNQHQIQELQRHLEAFVALRHEAARAVPELQQHMEQLSQELAEKLGAVSSTMHEGAMEFGRSVERTNSALTEASHVVSAQSEQIGQNMKDAADDFGSSVRGTLEAMMHNSQSLEQQMGQAVELTARALAEEFKRMAGQIQGSLTSSVEAAMASMRSTVESNLNQTETQVQGSANRTLGAVEAQVREATERAGESLKAQLNAMDQAIGRELEKVFREMGSALSTISRRIADDHAELTQRMRVQ